MDIMSILSVAVLAVLLIAEFLYVAHKKLNFFNTHDALANMILGLVFGLLSLAFAVGIYKLYDFLYQFRFFTLPYSI
jgi:sterol desaturase/sphingolipid hydroxylase (fatty acid hydroxylase superfamily)